jgi:hypothetical protein
MRALRYQPVLAKRLTTARAAPDEDRTGDAHCSEHAEGNSQKKRPLTDGDREYESAER